MPCHALHGRALGRESPLTTQQDVISLQNTELSGSESTCAPPGRMPWHSAEDCKLTL